MAMSATISAASACLTIRKGAVPARRYSSSTPGGIEGSAGWGAERAQRGPHYSS
jgi:hypothetical protein